MTLLPQSQTRALRRSSPAVRRTSSLVVTPAVVGHRGASGHLPEHTLEAYRHAIALGADEIELDLVSTADGVLVARHERELSATTDIAERPELAHRRTTRLVAGRPVEGWFVEDLALEEVRLLRAKERWPGLRGESAAYDGTLAIATFDEVLAMLAEESERHRRSLGVLVELKDPAYSSSLGLDLLDPLLDDLRRHGRDHPRSRVSVMSFEPTALRSLAGRVRVPLIQLVDHLEERPADLAAAGDPRTFADLVTPGGLALVERYADGIGARHTLVAHDLGDRVVPTRLVRDAHREWLTVHVWTLRAEDRFLPAAFRGDLRGYADLLLELGVDGLITDHPEHCLAARDDADSLVA